MITVENEVLLDFATSCTKDIAVAKLLGWLRGPIRSRIIQITENGISLEQLPFLPELEGTLVSFMAEKREALRQDFARAIESDDATEVINRKITAIELWDETIVKAAAYLRDIDDELAKGEISALRIDKAATAESGEVHITLKSLELWANKEFGISFSEVPKANENLSTSSEDAKHDAIDDPDDGLSKIKADHLYTSLAFAVDALAERIPNLKKTTGEPNVIVVAKHLSKIATEANHKHILLGQGEEAIKKRITEAIRIQRKKLKGG